MKQRVRNILVAIADPRHPPLPELRKAGRLARAAGASLELFHVIDDPDPGASFPETANATTIAQRRAAIAAKYQQRLERLARDPCLRGVRVACRTTWDYPAHEAIVRRVRATHADLVIGATRRHRFAARLVLRNTDWELIRHCPVPLLLVKSPHRYDKPVVLAAVDPFHAHARPAHLDAQLLQIGGSVARLLHGALHVFHAYMPLVPVAPVRGVYDPLVMLPQEAEAAHARQIISAVGKLAQSAGVPAARRHVQMGDVAGELAALTERSRVALVVMGAVSRSALKRLFIGNAAERVLDALGCDVLIVKPRGFRTSIPRAAALASPAAPRRARSSRPARRAPRPARIAPDMTLPALL